MTEFIREVFGRGKVTIPRELRELYDLQDGDYVTLKLVKVARGGAKGPGTEADDATVLRTRVEPRAAPRSPSSSQRTETTEGST